MECPDDDVLAGWLGDGDPARTAALHEHLDACPRCSALLAELGRLYEPDEAETEAEADDDALTERYRIDGILGAGGMGVVYRGYDLRLQRPVALKGLHTSTEGSGPSLARLRREARLMARIPHPNVVEVLEVLRVDEAIYVVMELVEGVDLRRWLSACPRTTEQIVEVFVAAGRGLAAAHAVGLVHRDFKPDNVLVGTDGRVKVGDFGLAHHADEGSLSGLGITRSTSTPGSERSRSQAVQEIVGTARYMAPEQRRGEPVDPRADVYAFGVSLAEALGLPPASPDGARPRVPGHILRVIGRATAEDPRDRFADLPLLLDALGRPRRGARWLALAGLALVLPLGLVPRAAPHEVDAPACDPTPLRSSVQLDRLRRQLEAAVGEALAEATHDRLVARVEGEASLRAELCAARGLDPTADAPRLCLAEHRAELEATLDALDGSGGSELSEVIDAIARLSSPERCRSAAVLPGASPEGAAEVERVRVAIARARAQRRAGQPERARSTLDRALVALQGREPGPLHAELLVARGRLLRARDRWAEAAEELERAYDLATAADRFALAEQAATELVMARLDDGAAPESVEGWVRHASTAHERAAESGDAFLLETMLGRHEQARGHAEEACHHLERARAEAEALHGPSHPDVWSAVHNLAVAHDAAGEYARATERATEAVAGRRALLGEHHPAVARSLRTLANAEARGGDGGAAEAHLRQALAIIERAHGPRDPQIAPFLDSLALHLSLQGRHEDGLALLERSVAILDQSLGPSHLETVRSRRQLGYTLRRAGDLDRARVELGRAWARLQGTVPDDHPLRLALLSDRANVAIASARPDEAEPLLREALESYRQRHPQGHSDVAITRYQLGHVLWQQGRLEAALLAFEAAEAELVEAEGPGSPTRVAMLLGRSDLLFELQRYPEAEAAAREALEILDPQTGATSGPWRRLGQLALVRGDHAEALAALERAAAAAEDRGDAEAAAHASLLRAHALIAAGRLRVGEALLARVRGLDVDHDALEPRVDEVLLAAGLRGSGSAEADAPR